METKTNYFAIILNVLGTILFTVALFLGLTLYFDGNLLVSIPIALSVALFLELLVFKASNLKAAVVNQHKAKPVRLTLLGIYLLIALATAPFIAHLITISMTQKTKIQAAYTEQESQFQSLFNNEKAISYRKYVDARLDVFFKDMNNQNMDGAKIGAEIDAASDDLLKYYKEVLNDKDQFIPFCCESVKNWNLFTINSQLSQWDIKKEEWTNKLIESSKNHEIGKENPFTVNISNRERLSSLLTTFKWNEMAWPLSVLLIIILHLMILFNYIATKSTTQGKIKGGKAPGTITY